MRDMMKIILLKIINFDDIDEYTSNKFLMKKKLLQRKITAFDIYIISKSQKNNFKNLV